MPLELLTDRLVLRSWSPEETAAVVAGARLPHWAEDFPAEGDQVIAGLFAEHPDWLGPYGHRQIIERDTGLVVGSIGLFWPPADGSPEVVNGAPEVVNGAPEVVNGALEIGYGVVPSRRGRGYASEATRALTEFARTAPGVETVFANVELSNPSSVRVLEKAGFVCEHRADDTARYRAM